MLARGHRNVPAGIPKETVLLVHQPYRDLVGQSHTTARFIGLSEPARYLVGCNTPCLGRVVSPQARDLSSQIGDLYKVLRLGGYIFTPFRLNQ
jgi:hypothetical protein